MKENTRFNGRAWLAALIIWILIFFFGWLIFGIALGPFYDNNTIKYEGMMKPSPDMTLMFISTLCQALLLIYTVYVLGRALTFGRGFVIGAIVFLLATTFTDLFVYATMNLYNTAVVIVDIILNGLFGGIMGGIAAWFIGRPSVKKDKNKVEVEPKV